MQMNSLFTKGNWKVSVAFDFRLSLLGNLTVYSLEGQKSQLYARNLVKMFTIQIRTNYLRRPE